MIVPVKERTKEGQGDYGTTGLREYGTAGLPDDALFRNRTSGKNGKL